MWSNQRVCNICIDRGAGSRGVWAQSRLAAPRGAWALQNSETIMAYDPWMNCGVEGGAHWPDGPMDLNFDGRQIHLLPADEKHCASVHVAIKRSRLDELAGETRGHV